MYVTVSMITSIRTSTILTPYTSREENQDLVRYTLLKIHFDIVHMQAALIAHVNFTA